jgi:microsomal dipeptidase-like Zn-dependent dipeptidase
MPFFDFHCHPSLKQLLAPPGITLTPWDQLSVKLNIGKLFGRETQIGINTIFNGVMNSQSNLMQMHKANVNLAGVIIYSIENRIAQGILLRKAANSGKINLLDPEIMRQLSNGNSYYEWTKKTMDALVNNPHPANASNGKPAFKFINSINEYNPDDAGTIHGLLILEGLHNFCNDPFSANGEADFENNFDDFRQRYGVRIFAVNIPHMQDFPFANHAFGMQFIKEDLFFPERRGLPDWGKRMIKKMYNNDILIDIKHMSYFTRTQLIAQRSQLGFDDRPLICTHAGVTGLHSNDRYHRLLERPKRTDGVWKIKHLKSTGLVPDSAFNHSSINLYDDEIVAILNSGGLIGISLDQRILGFPIENIAYQLNDLPFDHEYIADAEQDIFFRGFNDPGDIAPWLDMSNVLSGDDALNQGEITMEVHYSYFLNQLLHILDVAKRNRLDLNKVSRQICIGSDFDGLINPLDVCPDVTSLEAFKREIRQRLQLKRTLWKNLSFSKSDLDIDALVDGLFFNNAFEFLKKHFV